MREMLVSDQLPTSEQSTAERSAPPCPKCKHTAVLPVAQTVFEAILSFQRFQCGRCQYPRRSQFGWTAIPKALLALGLLGAAVYLARSPRFLNYALSSRSSVGETERLAQARAAAGGQGSTFEQMMNRKPKATLDNAEILRLWRADVGTSVVLQMIRTSNGSYDVSTNAIIALREARVDQSIILAIIDANYNSR